jgi:putative ABC transport system ATP-binding protein
LVDEAAACSGLVKIYWTATGEVHALKDIDAIFPKASMTAVVGPSGSGKSSLLRIVCGRDRPTAGSVRVGGLELAGLRWGRLERIRRRRIGYVFQRPSDNLIPHLTVEGHLRQAAHIRHPLRRGRFDDLLEILGLTQLRNSLPHELSGGEQQRVAFAQAVVGEPALVCRRRTHRRARQRDGRPSAIDRLIAHSPGDQPVGRLARPRGDPGGDQALYLRHGVVEAETREHRLLSVIDQAGRIQIPHKALRLFPERRAVISEDGRGLRIDPP